MIFVGGIPLTTDPSFSSSPQETDTLNMLIEHPTLLSASESFNSMSKRKFPASEESNLEKSTSKCVYVFQREYATVDPAVVDLVGTDEATTCVGICIRNQKSGMTSIAHMDSPDVVDIGLTQMLSLVVSDQIDDLLDVHIVGAFEDVSNQAINHGTKSRKLTKVDGYSVSLCAKIIESLQKNNANFHIQTFHVLAHNTRWDSQGNAFPIFDGFVVEPSSGSVFPASFDITSRCPDEIIRRIRLSASFEDPSCFGRLLEIYDTQNDQIMVAPFTWTSRQLSIAFALRHLSDAEILLSCSTSPSAEGPDFVDTQRRRWEYLIEHPDWRKLFPAKKPRVFERNLAGGWRQL